MERGGVTFKNLSEIKSNEIKANQIKSNHSLTLDDISECFLLLNQLSHHGFSKTTENFIDRRGLYLSFVCQFMKH